MDNELKSLRIDKGMKARRDERSRWPWAAALAVALLGGAAVAWNSRSALSGGPRPVATAPVVAPEGAVGEQQLVMLSATGYVVAAAKIEVAGKVVGRVKWIGVERGDKVEAGQVIVRLEDEEYQARYLQQQGLLEAAKARLAELEAGNRPEEVARAKADLDASIVDVENAEINLKRFRDLMPTKSVSRQQLDDAEADLRSKRARAESVRQQYLLAKAGPRQEQVAAQRAAVRQAEGGLALARVDLDNTLIRSPIAGTILARNVEVGEFVTTGFVGDAGAKGFVVSLADLNELRVELDIQQGDFAKTRLGQPAWVTTDAYPDRKYEGVVDLISPEANRQKATVQVRVKVLRPDGLMRPDMNATVAFLDEKRLAEFKAAEGKPAAERPAIRVPTRAVREGAVFVVEGGKAARRPVMLGAEAGGEVEVRRGLAGGETLVVDPPPDLKDGEPVKAEVRR